MTVGFAARRFCYGAAVLSVVPVIGSGMQRDNRITAAIRPTVEDMGFQLVRAQMTGTVRPILQIMAEPNSGGAMTVQNCADLSRALSAVLDVEDPIGGAYTLEVSSPGVDRPLTRPQDFETYAGFDARVELDQAIDGQRRLKGKLCGLDEDGHVVIGEGEARVKAPMASIRRAKLLLTDALIAAHVKQGQPATQSDEG
jgi:ribosome maturation factor RimP